jgi:hypothetical protein
MKALRKLLRAIACWVRGPLGAGFGTPPAGSAGFEEFFGSTRGGRDDH